MPQLTIPQASSETGFFRASQAPDSKYDPSAIGLAFSGGGYRATLFHAGSLLRLNELGILSQASRISSVSGGSITTGILAMNWDKIDWNGASEGVATHDDMIQHVLKPVMDATARGIDIGVSVLGFVPGISGGNELARTYDKHIFHDVKLNEITNTRRFLFCAANLQTGGLVRFTKDYVADWQAFFSTTNTIKLSHAVAASSGFPPILAPMRLDLRGETVTAPKGARYDSIALRERPVLVDGGVYDNIGLEPIWKRCGILIASNAGSNNPAKVSQFRLGMMPRVLSTFLDVSVNWRERMLVNMYRNELADGLKERNGAYWTIKTPTNRLAWDGYKASPAQLKLAADMATRLKKFPIETQHAAVLAGYSYTDGTIRKYLRPDAPAPQAKPVLP
ncbi:MAG: patatin-like phospholipase family protein [Litoreibacter sp.]|uniref:patatin-like phospholipase family protein n=1 Tax=Litoreibacter sp. TaxID=1969459 RepID=UPI0032991150